MTDIDNKELSELDQDLDDVEEAEEEETDEETKIKAYQVTVEMIQNPQILSALQERLDEGECEWKPDEEEEVSEELKEKAKIEDEKKDEGKEDPKGIPEFWLTVFKDIDLLSDMVQEHDEPILKHLKDIKVKFSHAGQPMSFILEFHFEPNEYFTNDVLTKTYRMRSEPENSDPLSFDGLEIMSCTGCQIAWKKGKNVTLKTIKMKQKHKGCGTVHTCQIEKKMIETSGKNNILEIQLEKSNSFLKEVQTKEASIKKECAALHDMIKGLQQTIEYQDNLRGENEQLKRNADMTREKLKSHKQDYKNNIAILVHEMKIKEEKHKLEISKLYQDMQKVELKEEKHKDLIKKKEMKSQS
ncbi:Nucleosome assembly protein 1-like 1 [Heterocephalus glaber]|uniref:Nucleosome assembly protein 1-like 1 n=1 Tax=Heterocephalus glaber TaxID=10181 RepID=G5B2X0_HETGA|nr:Nucleosome assembly protein 1-like 1 [Heterocephalus glaber]